MSAVSLVGYQYAQALIELAEAQGRAVQESVLKDLIAINQGIRNTPEFEIVLHHPSVPREQKKALLIQAFQGKVQELTLRLVELLCDKGRITLLLPIEHAYHELFNEKMNIATATITSAEPLNDDQINQLKTKLAAKLGKQLELDVKVNEALIGGLVLRVGDEVIDGSIKGKLRALEKSLLSV